MPLAIAADIPRGCQVACGFSHDGFLVWPMLPASVAEIEISVLCSHERPRLHAMPALWNFWQDIPLRARYNTPWSESGFAFLRPNLSGFANSCFTLHGFWLLTPDALTSELSGLFSAIPFTAGVAFIKCLISWFWVVEYVACAVAAERFSSDFHHHVFGRRRTTSRCTRTRLLRVVVVFSSHKALVSVHRFSRRVGDLDSLSSTRSGAFPSFRESAIALTGSARLRHPCSAVYGCSFITSKSGVHRPSSSSMSITVTSPYLFCATCRVFMSLDTFMLPNKPP